MEYQKLLNKLINKEYSIITKLSLLYEINCKFECELDDDTLNNFYQAFMDNKNYNSVFDFVNAIDVWCQCNDKDFKFMESYDEMLKDLW